MAFRNRKIEMILACASFGWACILSILGLLLSPEHDISGGVCMVTAQFLLLTASIIGIDYKLNNIGSSVESNE